MNAKQKKLTLTGPVMLDGGNMVMPEDLTRMAEISDLTEQIGNLWNQLSSGAQGFLGDVFTSESVLAMSGRNCAAEAVDYVCKARPEMVFHKLPDAAAPISLRNAAVAFLCDQIFAHNEFETPEVLFEAINQARAISRETHWGQRKHAFNQIAEMAPMRDDCYSLTYEEAPEFITKQAEILERELLQKIAGATSIPRFELRNDSSNPEGYTVNAQRDGDAGIYDELRVGVFDRDGSCVADVLVGLSGDGEPRVLLSTDGDADRQKVAVFPLRSFDEAVVDFDADNGASAKPRG